MAWEIKVEKYVRVRFEGVFEVLLGSVDLISKIAEILVKVMIRFLL